MKPRLLLLALAAASALHAADSVPAFNAVLNMGKEQRFVLVGLEGKPSDWLKLGDTYEGYTIKSFDSKDSTLDLEHGGKTVKVSLVGGAGVKDTPVPTHASLADAQALLNKMRFDEMLERTLAQQKKAMAAMFDQMAAQNNHPGVNKDDLVAFQQKMTDELTSAMNTTEMKNDMAQIYSDVFTKDEIDGLSSFYGTPAGEALIEKQPEVQQKMQALMMPRMMAVMPKIQQMTRDFAADQKAKAAAAAQASAPAPAAP
jgi:hypothetical protein